jgi:acyl-coenzyme A thioesterase PaaI-like protein
MESPHAAHTEVWDALRARLGDRIAEYPVPPPVFVAMQAEFVAYDPDGPTLTTRLPILDSYLNPYGTMQGGMIAAAVDNTLGPLSMLVAPPNVTRRLELTYGRPITLDTGYILVTARLLERDGRRLLFRADVCDSDDRRMARARAVHWIVDT